VGIVLGMLRKLAHTDRSRPVWAGALAAVVVSVAAGLALNAMGMALLLAAGVLTWMISWMQHQGRQIQAGLELDARRAITTSNMWA